MPACSIVSCRARKSKNQPELTLHRFPKNEKQKKKWLDSIGKKNISLGNKVWFICSLHFDEKCFNRTLGVVRLHENSVPTMFSTSDKTQPPESFEFCDPGNTQESDDSCSSTVIKEQSSVSTVIDEPSTVMEAPLQLTHQFAGKVHKEIVQTRNLRAFKEKYVKQQKTIKCLNERIRRKDKKIAGLEDSIKDLRRKNSINVEQAVVIDDLAGPKDFIKRQINKSKATHCAIENCRTTVLNKSPGVSLHPCPKSNEMRKRWLRLLNNKCSVLDWNKSQICSKHFEPKYFDSQRRLTSNAVPTCFAPNLPKIAPKPAPSSAKPQNKYSKPESAQLPSSKSTSQPSSSNIQGKKELVNKKPGFVSRVPWTYETEPRHGVEPSRSKVDRSLNKLTQAELTASIKASMSKLKEPADLDSFVTDDLRCRPDAPKEAVLWLMVKKQDHLNNRLMELVVQTKKHVEILSNKSEEAKKAKRENEQTIESLKYIVKCLQEKHATLEEQIEILTAVESR